MMKKIFFIAIGMSFSFLVPVLIRANSINIRGTKPFPVKIIPSYLIPTGFSGANHEISIVPAVSDTVLLPMTLIEFRVNQVAHNCCLIWKAVREEYSPGYTVERSLDGTIYTEAGTTGHGKEIGLQQFSFTDYGAANLGSRVIFYRLKQLNAEGKSEYTHVIAITVNHNGSFATLFPNPAVEQASLLVHVSQEETMEWNLTDQVGRTLKLARNTISPGASRINIDLKGLPPGIYYLQLKSASVSSQMKLLKM